jgi:hypothetical protein
MREDACCQIAKAEEKATEKFLSYFTVDRYQKITKHEEIEIASLLPSLQISNVSKSTDIQSIKQQQDEMKQHIGGLEKTIIKLTRTFEKSVAPSFSSYETSNTISVSKGVFGCGTARTGSSPDVLSRPSNFEGQQGTTQDSTVPTLDPEPNNLI